MSTKIATIHILPIFTMFNTTRAGLRRIQSALILLAGIAGCADGIGIAQAAVGTAAATAAPKEIRIAAPDMSAGPLPSPGGGTIAVIYIKKALEDEFRADHIAVHWTLFRGAGPAINEAFSNGQIDFAYLGDLASLIGRANGLDTRLIAAADHGANMYLAVPPNSSIRSIKDLRGKRVGVFRGTADQLSFDRALHAQGLDERDLQVINLDWSASKAALAAAQIDAVWSGQSLLVLRDKGLAKIVVSTRGESAGATTQAGLVVSQSFASAYPAITTRVVKVLAQTAAWAADPANRQALVTLVSQQSAIPATVYNAEYGGDDLHFRFSPRIDDFLIRRLQASLDAAHQAKLVRHSFDVASWADPHYVDAALAQLGSAAQWRRYDANGNALP